MDVWVVIPAFNEERTIFTVVQQLRAGGYDKVVVVDDGSGDRTADRAAEAGALVARHSVNRGAGAATLTGMRIADMHGAAVMVTFDADGQHHVKDIASLLVPIQEGKAEVVLGVRNNKSGMPFIRRIANKVANIVTWLLSGIWVRDSQSGLRAYTRHALGVMDLHANGYEFCSEVIREMHHRKLTYVQVPVAVTYTPETLAKGQSFDTGIGTLAKLIIRSIMR